MNNNPSQLHNELEKMKNFPLQFFNSPGSNSLEDIPNLNTDKPLETPNFAASKSVENFGDNPDFTGSNNINGDNALFGGGNNFDELKNDLENSMKNEVTNFFGKNKMNMNENTLNDENLQTRENGFNSFNDNIDQKDGAVNNQFLSNGEFDQSRLYESNDDMWNVGQYDSISNYDFPSSYYDNNGENNWMMEDYPGYRRLVEDVSNAIIKKYFRDVSYNGECLICEEYIGKM